MQSRYHLNAPFLLVLLGAATGAKAQVEPQLAQRYFKQLCVLENLYSHEGTRGHEIVFAFEAELVGSEFESKASFSFFDGGVTNDVAWRPVREFVGGYGASISRETDRFSRVESKLRMR